MLACSPNNNSGKETNLPLVETLLSQNKEMMLLFSRRSRNHPLVPACVGSVAVARLDVQVRITESGLTFVD